MVTESQEQTTSVVVVEEEKKETKSKMKEVKYQKEDLMSFHELFLSRPIVKACSKLHYDHPTSIQRRSVLHILDGKDVMINAVTGSGKTAAYLLPVLEKLHRNNLSGGAKYTTTNTKVLIVHPTRELAAQCASMFEHLSTFIQPPIECAVYIGGSTIKNTNPDVIIATPGRIIDVLMNSKNVHLEGLEMLILDEADKLLEMGFKESVH